LIAFWRFLSSIIFCPDVRWLFFTAARMTLNYYSPNAALPAIFPSISSASLNISMLVIGLFRISFQQIRFHDLRHTAASLMLNHGIPVIVVSKMLGHSKPSITMDIYGHLNNEMQD
jgi:integrase